MQIGFPWTNTIRVGLDFRQSGRRHQIRKIPRILAQSEVVRLVERRHQCDISLGINPVAVNQLNQANPSLLTQFLEVGHLKRLNDDRRRLAGIAILRKHFQQSRFDGQTGLDMVGRVLCLRVNTNRPASTCRFRLGEVKDFSERGDLELLVEGLITDGIGLFRIERTQFGECEISDKPTCLGNAINLSGRLAVGKLRTRGHVGRRCDVGLVTGNQFAIFGHNEVRLDKIGTHLDRLLVGGKRVFRKVATCATMTDNHRFVSGKRGIGRLGHASSACTRCEKG